MPALRDRCAQQAVPIMDWDAFQGDGAGQMDVLVDALLALGITGLPESRLLKPLNGGTPSRPIIALDVPSGLPTSPPRRCGSRFHTVTFIALGLGLAAEQVLTFQERCKVALLGAPDGSLTRSRNKASTLLSRQPYRHGRGLRIRVISAMYW